MYLSFKSVCNKEHKGVICNMTSSSNSFQSTRPSDFTRNYEQTSGIFVPWERKYLSCLISPHLADTGIFLKYYQAAAQYSKFENFHENFILTNCVERHICNVKICD